MSPSIQFSENTGALSGVIGKKAPVLGAIAENLKRKQAATTSLLVDNRIRMQASASVGEAKRFNFGAGLGGVDRRCARCRH